MKPVWQAIAAGVFAVTAASAAPPQIYEYTSGYACVLRADGAFGRIELDEELWENGAFRTIKANWQVAGAVAVLVAPPEGVKIGVPGLKLDFYSADESAAPKIKGALATLDIAPIQFDTFSLYATADGKVQTLMPKFNGLQYIFDDAFLAALEGARDIRFDLMRPDGSAVARLAIRPAAMAEGFATLARLETEARQAAKDYKNTCDAITTMVMPS